ncbi:uncharacterized protein BN804_00515 [Firmicutes bacterium CAG:884]|nr:uncharacterized protein BN804_00515 [Firmicutes bacterium CAG:884]
MELKYAKKFKDRLIGLMFKKNINYCLCFSKCNSIHTFFMKENIIVVFTDKNKNILKKVTCPKNRILFCKKAYFTYEFPYYTKDEEINYILKSNS